MRGPAQRAHTASPLTALLHGLPGRTPPGRWRVIALDAKSPAARLAKRLRRRPGVLAEEADEMRRVRETELGADLVDRRIGEDDLPLSLGQQALADQVARGDA